MIPFHDMEKPLITSPGNPFVKQVRALHQKKARLESGTFLVEGIHHVGEAVQAGWEVDSLLYAPDLLTSTFGRQLVSRLGRKTQPVSAQVMESLADKDNPQGILAVVRQKQIRLEDLSGSGAPGARRIRWAAGLVSPQDPGNVGTILRTLDAVGIALSQAAGSMQYLENGAWTKRLHPGFAAHDALVSLALARAGVRGAARALDGRYGLLTAYSSAPTPQHLVDRLGERWVLTETAIKPYPSCRFAHGAIDAALLLRDRTAAEAREHAHIEIRLSPKSYQIVGEALPHKVHPRNIVDGQFSVYAQTALAWLDGRVDWGSYDRLGDTRLHALMDRMHVKADETIPLAGAELTVTLDGEQLSERVEQPLGEPECPVPWERIEAKFTSLASGVLGTARARRVIGTVRAIESEPSMPRWARLLRPGGRRR